MKQTTQGLLISLDMILDTRLAVLNKMDVSYPEKVLLNGWKERDGDFYEQWIPDFDRDLFNTHWWYRGRDGDVHKNSLVTGYMARLISDVKILRAGSYNHPMVGETFVDINTYPYTLTDMEASELQDIISGFFKEGIKVGVVRINPKQLTPKVIRSKWCSFSIYNFEEWLALHKDALIETPIPSVVCITPKLYKTPPEEIPETDPTLEVTGALVEFLGMEFIPPDEVSIAI